MVLNNPTLNDSNQVKGGFIADDTLLNEGDQVQAVLTILRADGSTTDLGTLTSDVMPAPDDGLLWQASGRLWCEPVADPAQQLSAEQQIAAIQASLGIRTINPSPPIIGKV
jgi:hypothetical protein